MITRAKTAPNSNKQANPEKPNHPKYSLMIIPAITAMKERGGASRKAILKYIMANFDVGTEVKVVNACLKTSLKAGVVAGALQQAQGGRVSVSLQQSEKNTPAVECKKKAGTTKKPAAKNLKKPAAKKPAAKEPAARKPAAKKPAASKPAAKKPAARKPAAKKPAAKKPASATKKTVKEPVAQEPAAKETANEEPASNPVTEEPVLNKPAAEKPNTAAIKTSRTRSKVSKKSQTKKACTLIATTTPDTAVASEPALDMPMTNMMTETEAGTEPLQTVNKAIMSPETMILETAPVTELAMRISMPAETITPETAAAPEPAKDPSITLETMIPEVAVAMIPANEDCMPMEPTVHESEMTAVLQSVEEASVPMDTTTS